MPNMSSPLDSGMPASSSLVGDRHLPLSAFAVGFASSVGRSLVPFVEQYQMAGGWMLIELDTCSLC